MIPLHCIRANVQKNNTKLNFSGKARKLKFGFHCHTIIKTIQQIKSRIKEIKEDEYTNSLAKIQVCAMFRAGDIQENVLLKFLRLCMEKPCLCPSEKHKYGGWKLTKRYVIEFWYKRPVVIFSELINIFLSTYSQPPLW